ncbi:MAG: hypothetical protein Q9227_002106 [Pyrenula ochraceoflavens]
MKAEATHESLFRPAKRRKFLRKRNGSDDEPLQPPPRDLSDEAFTVSDLIKQRKANKSKRSGITFSASECSSAQDTNNHAVVLQDPEAERLRAITERFAPQTGQAVDIRMDYIDSEMAKRRLGSTQLSSTTASAAAIGGDDRTSAKRLAQRQPASLGKIHEIDLGHDATTKNALRTELAIRKQKGEKILEEEPPAKQQKVRIGRNGKPIRRGPKRRKSEDVERDKLVEDVLRENKIDLYEAADEESEEGDGELEADERVAEQFRQDFLEAMQSRQRHRNSGQPKPPNAPGTKPGEVLKGPKLGGSRNTRAAMREKELQLQKAKKGL